MNLFALLDFVIVDSRRDPSGTVVLQAHPVDCVHVLDLFSVDVAVEPQVEAAASIW